MPPGRGRTDRQLAAPPFLWPATSSGRAQWSEAPTPCGTRRPWVDLCRSIARGATPTSCWPSPHSAGVVARPAAALRLRQPRLLAELARRGLDRASLLASGTSPTSRPASPSCTRDRFLRVRMPATN